MANLIDTLKARGVAQAFPLLQLDFSELFEKRFTRGNARVYDHHEWIVRDVPALGRDRQCRCRKNPYWRS